MKYAMTLSGSGLAADSGKSGCKCVYNPRTKKSTKLCKVPKGKGPGKSRSGWAFRGRC